MVRKIQIMIAFTRKNFLFHLAYIFSQDERGKMLAHFQDLKAQMNKARGEERRKLTKLTKESNGAISELSTLKQQGEAILRLAEHCRKLMVRYLI